jgi:hypothetical protein
MNQLREEFIPERDKRQGESEKEGDNKRECERERVRERERDGKGKRVNITVPDLINIKTSSPPPVIQQVIKLSVSRQCSFGSHIGPLSLHLPSITSLCTVITLRTI